MIEKLNEQTIWSENFAMRQEAPSNYELMEKINEIIDYLNANNE